MLREGEKKNPWNFHQTYSNQAVVRSANEMAGVRAWHCRLWLSLSPRFYPSVYISRFFALSHTLSSSLKLISPSFRLPFDYGFTFFKRAKYFTHLLSLVLKVIVWSRCCQYNINGALASSRSPPISFNRFTNVSRCPFAPELHGCNHLFTFTLTFLTENQPESKVEDKDRSAETRLATISIFIWQ